MTPRRKFESNAERLVAKPDTDVRAIMKAVREVALHTQSEAYQYHDAGDGSVVEVKAAPDPAIRASSTDNLPEPGEDIAGFLAEVGGNLWRCRHQGNGDAYRWQQVSPAYLDRTVSEKSDCQLTAFNDTVEDGAVRVHPDMVVARPPQGADLA